VIDETILEAIDKMEKAVLHVQSQFATVRTGRAAPALVEQLQVEYYGAHVPLQQLASIQVPEARQLLIKPHDRASLPAVEKSTMVSLFASIFQRSQKSAGATM
jgi:ribosome recycling factor